MVDVLDGRKTNSTDGPIGMLARVLDRRLDRLALLLVALTATVATFAETGVLFVISLTAVRLSDEEIRAVDLPFGVPLDELSNTFLLGAGATALVVRLIALSSNAYVAARVTQSLIYRWRRRLFLAFQSAQWRTQSSEKDGALQTVTQTHVARVGNMAKQLTSALTAGISFVTFLVGALLISPLVALGLFVFGASLFLLLRPLARLVRSLSTAERRASNEYSRLLEEASAMSLEHKAFGTGETVAALLEEQLDLQARAGVRQRTVTALAPQIYTVLGYGAVLAGLAFATRLNLDDVAVLGAMVLMLIRSIAYGQTFQATTQAIAGAQPYAVELLETIARLDADAIENRVGDHQQISTIELRDASLGYEGARVCQGVNLKISAGESIGVVGPSGAGKSTLALTLLRLLPPLEGDFMINDRPVEEFARSWWHRTVSFVPQQPALFDGSVAENIAFHRNGIAPTEIESAARLSHLGAAMESWPNGLDHEVGPRGGHLSGGQRQRVCIARALASQPQVLILDEPTSALDSTAEASITDVLSDLRDECTLVVIAHRLSTLTFCDRVILIEGGSVIEIGSGAHVLKNPALAATLSSFVEEEQ